MDIATFLLERNQTLYENNVEFNLTESGIHPCNIRDLLSSDQVHDLVNVPLGYGYTEGRPGLRAAIASWYDGATARNVVVTHGASEANLLSVLTLLSPGDEVLFVLPNFMQIPGISRSLGISVSTYSLSEELDWQPDLRALESAIGPRTRMIALANPNNPTGQVFTHDSMRGIVDLAARHKLYLLADEIYRGAEIDRPETPSFFGQHDRVVVTSSLSKAFAMPGLRLGWIVAPEALVPELMRRQDYTSIGTGILSQILAEQAVGAVGRSKAFGRGRRILSENVGVLESWVQRGGGIYSCRRPQAGAIALVRYSLPMPSVDFSTQLRERKSVFVVAGSWFGIESHMRIGIGCERSYLEEGLKRIDAFVTESGEAAA